MIVNIVKTMEFKYTPLTISQIEVNIEKIKERPTNSIETINITEEEFENIINEYKRKVPSIENIKYRDGTTSVIKFVKSTVFNGLPLLYNTVLNVEIINMSRYILKKIVNKKNYTKRFLEGFKDCQQVQCRTIYSMYCELNNCSQLEMRIKYILENLKKIWLHKLITKYNASELSIDAHTESSYVSEIGNNFGFMDYMISSKDSMKVSLLEKSMLINDYIKEINAEDIILQIYDEFSIVDINNDEDIEKQSILKNWLEANNMYNTESYDEMGKIKKDTIIDILLKMDFIILPSEYREIKKYKAKHISIDEDYEYIYESENESEEEDETYEEIVREKFFKIIELDNLPIYLKNMSENVKFMTIDLTDIELNKLNMIITGPIKLKSLMENVIKLQYKKMGDNIKSIIYNFDDIIEIFKISYCSCPICYKKHETNVETLVPCKDCLIQFMEFEYGKNIETYIIENPILTELLISLTYHACCDRMRRDFVLNPYPEKYISKENNRIYDDIIIDINKLPSVTIMQELIRTNEFRSYFFDDFFLKQQYYLLNWIINSNRTNLILVIEYNELEKKLMENYDSKALLFKITNAPEKEVEFRNAKNDETEYAYHGSSISNWHSIIRHSLKILSGTEYMSTGAAYGNGIYLAKNINMAISYSKTSSWGQWEQSERNYKQCILIVEKYKNININNKVPPEMYVVNDDRLIIMRYLLVLTI